MKSSKKEIFVIKVEITWIENKHGQGKYQQNQMLYLQKTKYTNYWQIYGKIKTEERGTYN